LLVGKTSSGGATVGAELRPNGDSFFTRASGASIQARRNGSAGEIAIFYQDSDPVGSIGTNGNSLYIDGGSSNYSVMLASDFRPRTSNGAANNDGNIDLGDSGARWKDLYLSGGVVFGATGGTVTSKTLDDYEEGTWTPSFGGDTTNPTITYNNQNGDYTKVGRIVHVRLHLYISGSASGGSGGLYIDGLPFTSANDGYVAGTVSYVSGWDTDAAPTMCLVNPNTTKIPLYLPTSSDPRNTSTRSQVSHLGTDAQIYLAVSYNV